MNQLSQILYYAPLFVPLLLTGGAGVILLTLSERKRKAAEKRIERALTRANTKAPNSTVRAVQAILQGKK